MIPDFEECKDVSWNCREQLFRGLASRRQYTPVKFYMSLHNLIIDRPYGLELHPDDTVYTITERYVNNEYLAIKWVRTRVRILGL